MPNSQLVEGEEAEDEGAKRRTRQKGGKPKHECNARIEELSKPKRWRVLGVWKCFGYLFDPERMQMFKERVQEQFSMSPEETELYFNSMREKKPKGIDMKALKKQIRKEKAAAKREAYLLFHKLIKKAMKYAYHHAPPLLMTPMLRIISDHVLELMATIHKIDVPKRTDCDNMSRFLIAISDWTAVFVANIYYQIEVEDRNDAERMRQLDKVKSEVTTVPAPSEVDATEKEIKETRYGAEEEEGEGLDGGEEAGGYY